MNTGKFSTPTDRQLQKPSAVVLRALKAVLPEYKDKTIVDLGAGMGRYVKALRTEGYNITGFDGMADVFARTGGAVYQMELTDANGIVEGITSVVGRPSVAICIEVGEHIPKRRSRRFVCNIAAVPTDLFVVSWATPGQRGRGHVNCKTVAQVVESFRRRNWQVCFERTLLLRMAAAQSINHTSGYASKFVAFVPGRKRESELFQDFFEKSLTTSR